MSHARDAQTSEGGGKPISTLLARLCEEGAGKVHVGDMLETGAVGGLPLLIFVLAAPNAIPVLPPGVVTGTGLILTPLSTLLLWKGADAGLPGWLSRRGMDRRKFCKEVDRLKPKVDAIEGVTRRRLPFLFGNLALRFTALVCLAMSVLILAPIPFANMIPGAALALMSLALIEEDGLYLLAGYAAAAVSLGVAYGLWHAGGLGLHALVGLLHP